MGFELKVASADCETPIKSATTALAIRKWHLGQSKDPFSVGQYDALLHWFQAFGYAVKVFENATQVFDNAIKVLLRWRPSPSRKRIRVSANGVDGPLISGAFMSTETPLLRRKGEFKEILRYISFYRGATAIWRRILCRDSSASLPPLLPLSKTLMSPLGTLTGRIDLPV